MRIYLFPEVMRDHQSHDVLLMCISCHQESNLHDFGLRKELEAECDAPIGTADDVKVSKFLNMWFLVRRTNEEITKCQLLMSLSVELL